MMRNLKRLGNTFHISIPTDEDGLVGRECPNPECLGYFKIKFGTGLKGENLPCHCPYCGHTAGQDHFWTQEQIKYAQSVAINKITSAMKKDFQAWDRELRRSTRNSWIKLSLDYKGRPQPIRYYREKELETKVTCEVCTLEYAIYGVFAYCPDCGTHNSLQILKKNLELAEKEIALAETIQDKDMRDHLIADALENAVSAFDGFGRETCKVFKDKATNPHQAENVSFQNLVKARTTIQTNFGFDLADGLTTDEWDFVSRCFQKRHLIAHKMGVVDEAYKKVANDPMAVVGRKVTINSDEVKQLIQLCVKIGEQIQKSLK